MNIDSVINLEIVCDVPSVPSSKKLQSGIGSPGDIDSGTDDCI